MIWCAALGVTHVQRDLILIDYGPNWKLECSTAAHVARIYVVGCHMSHIYPYKTHHEQSHSSQVNHSKSPGTNEVNIFEPKGYWNWIHLPSSVRSSWIIPVIHFPDRKSKHFLVKFSKFISISNWKLFQTHTYSISTSTSSKTLLKRKPEQLLGNLPGNWIYLDKKAAPYASTRARLFEFSFFVFPSFYPLCQP